MATQKSESPGFAPLGSQNQTAKTTVRNFSHPAAHVNTETATEPHTALIEVIDLTPLAGAGPLRAFASVRLGSVIIHDCRVVQQSGQRPWVSLPQREYLHDGQKKYAPVVEVSDPLKREVSLVVLAAWERRASDAC